MIRSKLGSAAARAAALGMALFAFASTAEAQHTEARDPTSGPFARGDRLSYDVSLSVGWKIEEIRDPLALTGRLALEVIEDNRSPAGLAESERIQTEPVTLILSGRLDLRRAAYAGPSGYWRLDAQSALFPTKLAALKARAGQAASAAGLAGRIARAEEELGIAAASLGARAFLAEVTADGAVHVEPALGDRLAPDLSEDAERALRSYLAQSVRLCLPAVERAPGARGRTFQVGRESLRCDQLDMRVIGAQNKARSGGAAFVAAAADETPTTVAAPFTLPALLGACYVPLGSERPATAVSLNLAVDPGTYKGLASGRATVTERHGFAVARELEVNEDVPATTMRPGEPRVRVMSRLKWKAVLREMKLGKAGAVEP